MANFHRHLLGEKTDPPASASGNTTSADSDITEANFDTNMVIILAALLCALICALVLNSFVRCALRCSRRLSAETPEQAALRLSATGLRKSALRQIPVLEYGSSKVSIPSTDCPICLVDFVDGEKVRVLPTCNHVFHVKCIDTWLVSRSSCPNCRLSLLESSSTAPSGESTAGGAWPTANEVTV